MLHNTTANDKLMLLLILHNTTTNDSLTHSFTVAIPPGGGIGGAAHNRCVSIPPASPAVVCTTNDN